MYPLRSRNNRSALKLAPNSFFNGTWRAVAASTALPAVLVHAGVLYAVPVWKKGDRLHVLGASRLWLEGRVSEIKQHNSVRVHYYGSFARSDEWIQCPSDRLWPYDAQLEPGLQVQPSCETRLWRADRPISELHHDVTKPVPTCMPYLCKRVDVYDHLRCMWRIGFLWYVDSHVLKLTHWTVRLFEPESAHTVPVSDVRPLHSRTKCTTLNTPRVGWTHCACDPALALCGLGHQSLCTCEA